MSNRGVQSSTDMFKAWASFVDELYRKSSAEQFGLSCEKFDSILQDITRKYLQTDPTQEELHQFCNSLRLEELALARACAEGSERAWEVFLTRYREKLYDIAGYITKEGSRARELADSLYADLYGTNLREGQRVSKLTFYTGRGSLEGWLRTVMAQEFVNRYRRQRRLVSLDEESEEGAQFATPEPEPIIAVDPRVESAVDEVLAGLPAEDRFVLASYFLDDRTLADIARSLRVHESTVCRKVEKLSKSLRKQLLAALGRQGMSRRQAQEALEVDVRDLQVNIRARLQENATLPFPKKKVEASAGKGS